MEKYYVIGFTNDEIAGRILSQISDIIRNDFLKTSQAAVKKEIQNPQQKWSTIKFEDPLISPHFTAKYKDYQVVLYINENAFSLLQKSNIRLKILEETTTPPEGAGIFLSMPHYE